MCLWLMPGVGSRVRSGALGCARRRPGRGHQVCGRIVRGVTKITGMPWSHGNCVDRKGTEGPIQPEHRMSEPRPYGSMTIKATARIHEWFTYTDVLIGVLIARPA